MMKNYPVLLTFVAAALLSIVCLVPNLRAMDDSGVMMDNGHMMIMKDGKMAGPMDSSMKMSDGATVMTDGTVKMKDGTEMHMKDGQMMTMDGKMMDNKQGGMMGGESGGMSH